MKIMKRETWPEIMSQAERSVLILAPWLDDDLVEELFGFIPRTDLRILFPRSTLQQKGDRSTRYWLRGVLDVNPDVEIRVVEEDIAACLVIDDEDFYYSETYADRLEDKADDTAAAIAYAEAAWSRGEPWD